MMSGGWVHYHVMDCFSKMLSCHQKLMVNVEGNIHQQYFKQNTVVSFLLVLFLLLNTTQLLLYKNTSAYYIVKFFVLQNILLTKCINFDNYKKEFLQTIGFSLFNAALVMVF
jgi:hypothetical protein